MPDIRNNKIMTTTLSWYQVRERDQMNLSRLFDEVTMISGPWRRTVWEQNGAPTCYIFAEEHENKGSCPHAIDISTLTRDIIHNTEGVHVFIEHFIHAMDITHLQTAKAEHEVCSAKPKAILNNLRNCLQVIRVNRPGDKNRIHFIDPRMDIVCILPDGKLFDAISHYVKHLDQEKKNVHEALLTIYEAFIHPLLTVVPDKFGLGGRMTGVMERFTDQMTVAQKSIFYELWKTEVIQNIKNVSNIYVVMHNEHSLGKFDKLKLEYTNMVNKFMDMWTLAQIFLAENNGMTACILYAGSLHALNLEKFIQRYGYTRTHIRSNPSLNSCLKL